MIAWPRGDNPEDNILGIKGELEINIGVSKVFEKAKNELVLMLLVHKLS